MKRFWWIILSNLVPAIMFITMTWIEATQMLAVVITFLIIVVTAHQIEKEMDEYGEELDALIAKLDGGK